MATNRFNGYLIFLHVLLIALAVLVVGLTRKNRELQAQLNPEVPQLTAGDAFEPVPVRGLDGRAEILDFASLGQESLLFVFTTTCDACRQNQENWRALYERFHDRYEVVGISLDEVAATTAYQEVHGLPFRVVVPDDPRAFAEAHKLYQVPVTVHVGRDGRVREAWLGVLREDSLNRLAAATASAVPDMG